MKFKNLLFYLLVLLSGLLANKAKAQSPDWVWANGMGGSDYDFGNAIALDAVSNVYVFGDFKSTVDFDPNPAITNLSSMGIQDAFVAKYDAAGNFIWVKQIGGIAGGTALNGNSIAIDAGGFLYLTGRFSGTVDFDPGAASYNLSAVSMSDIFVCKLDNAGNFVWAKQLGGTSDESAYSIALDATNNIYLSGFFSGSLDFDPGVGIAQISALATDAFVCKLDNAGNYEWAKAFSGANNEEANALSVDVSGNIYATGFFIGTADFDPGVGLFNLSSVDASFKDVFVCKLDNSGNFIWAKSIGGTGNDEGNSIKVDADGAVFISGNFFGLADFDPDLAIHNIASSGSNDAFITKLDTDGHFIWANKLGGQSFDSGLTLSLSASGNVFFAGQFYQQINFDSPALQIYNLTSAGGIDLFLAKVDSSGNFSWAKSVGGSNHDLANSISIDAFDNVFITGSYNSTALNFDSLTILSPSNAQSDIFIARLGCSTSSTINPFVCGNYSSPSGKYNWTLSGTYLDTVPSFTGCDSVITIHLTINTTTSALLTLTACNQYKSPSAKYTWTSSGIYHDTIPNTAGCDSIITVQLTINNSSFSSQMLTVCDALVSPSGEHLWTTSGTYTDTIPNAFGCDSILTIQLLVNYSSSSTETVSACISYPSPSGNYSWTVSGTYTDTIANLAGCDSIITIHLLVDNPENTSGTITACNSFVAPSGNSTWFTSGIYSDTIQNTSGCYDIVTIDLTIITSSSASQTIAACNSFISPSQNYIWTNSGTYLDTLSNAVGCDSIVTTFLTINNGGTSILTVNACDSYTSPSGNYLWSFSGIYTDSIAKPSGCDSVITINLTIGNTTYFSQNVNACNSFTLPGGQTQTNSGTYVDTIPNSQGCDSIITTQLQIGNNASSSSQVVSACNSFTSPSGNYTWTSSGLYTDTIPNIAGCDSVVTFLLTLRNSSASVQQITACNSYTAPSGNNNWSMSGTYFDTIPNIAGCDSSITIQLTIYSGDTTLNATGCDSLIINSQTFTTSGTYTQVLTNANGCDSTITLFLAINNSFVLSSTVMACDSFSWNNQTLFSSGVYSQNYSSANGCDSSIVLHLNINQSSDTVLNQTVCNEFVLNGVSYTFSGIYTQSLVNTAQCDSTITLNLSVSNGSSVNFAQTACDSLVWGSQTYNSSGIYTQNYTNQFGCDSVVTLDLSINNSTSVNITQTACDSLVWNNQTYTLGGMYIQGLTSITGCDSTVILNLNINKSSSDTIAQTTCDSLVWNNLTYTSSGYYSQILSGAAGCDSSVVLNLTVNLSSAAIVTESACSSFVLNGTTYSAAGTYTQSLINSIGCDSILTLNLTLNNTANTITQSACDSLVVNAQVYSTSGTYTQTFVNASGCDSVLTLNLSINTVDTSVVQSSNILSASATGATFQWMDCSTNQAIAGAVLNSFTATANGVYAVMVSQNACTATSACYTVLNIGISNNLKSTSSIQVFPNPAQNEFQVLGLTYPVLGIELYNLLGEKCNSPILPNEQGGIVFDVSQVPAGVYLLKIETVNSTVFRKLILEK